MYVRTPGAAVAPGTLGITSRIVYMHRCPMISGCSVRGGGTNDSRTDTSTIADGIRQLGEFAQGDEVWNNVMACVTKTFEPFNITITDVDPGNVPHFENMVGGKATDISDSSGLQNTLGLAPFDCGEIANAIVYTFDPGGNLSADRLCWTSAQEIAHAFGLSHEFLQKDPLTYLDGDLPKRFRDETAPCGEFEQFQRCDCGGATQNSYRKIVGLFGPGAPTPPEVAFKRLTDGKTVQPGFKAFIEALDDVRVEKVDLYVDGTLVGTATTQISDDFQIVTSDIAAGDHVLEARATDVQGVVGTATVSVVMGPPCKPDKGCTGKDVCVEGVCIPGPSEPGGLGSICQKDGECLSLQCADAGEAHKYCVETCSLNNADSCPGSFDCISGGGGGVCWPSGDSGCCETGRGSAPGPLLLGLGVMLVVVGRRRKRR
jgi:hypothetical protein